MVLLVVCGFYFPHLKTVEEEVVKHVQQSSDVLRQAINPSEVYTHRGSISLYEATCASVVPYMFLHTYKQ